MSGINTVVGKAPAFMFYAAEFLADAKVVMMSNSEVGCYIKLICYCWREGSIPADISRLARLCGEDSTAMAVLWQNLKPCFTQSKNDCTKLVHPRLEKERIKQETRRNEKVKSGQKGAAARWAKDAGQTFNPDESGASKNSTAMILPMAKDSFALAFAISNSKTKTPLPPKGGVGDGEDKSTDEKTMTGGADAPAASREKSAGQEKVLVTVATQVNGDLFGEHQDSTLNTSPIGNGLAGEPPSCAPPPVPAGSKKMAAKVVDEPIVLPEWIKPEDWAAFINERKGSKKPMSAEAQRRAIGVLEKLRAEGNDPAAVINQSIVSGWMGLFPLKNNGGRTSSVPQSRQAVRDAMSGMHHGFDKKDYSEGVTADGRLID